MTRLCELPLLLWGKKTHMFSFQWIPKLLAQYYSYSLTKNDSADGARSAINEEVLNIKKRLRAKETKVYQQKRIFVSSNLLQVDGRASHFPLTMLTLNFEIDLISNKKLGHDRTSK